MKLGGSKSSPGQHASKTRPRASRDQEAHCWVRYGVPSSPNKQDDGSIEGIDLWKQKKKIRDVDTWLLYACISSKTTLNVKLIKSNQC